MTALAEMGAIIAPPIPGFYHKPQTVLDIVDHSVDRVLDLAGREGVTGVLLSAIRVVLGARAWSSWKPAVACARPPSPVAFTVSVPFRSPDTRSLSWTGQGL